MKKYLITSADFYTQNPKEFSQTLETQCLKHRPDYALYRDKTNPHYESLAKDFVRVCSGFKALKYFLHGDADLAKRLDAVGVHLTSMQFDKVEYAKSLGLEVIISTHTYEEVLKAQELGADAVTYSPVFASPGKGEPKGVLDLEKVLVASSINIFALGGIVEASHIQQIEKTSVYGFASIRYFY